MSVEQVVVHDHAPVYRVVRAVWPDPLDASFSRDQTENRWNPPHSFAVLYTSCSERVARAIVRDLLRLADVDVEDLQPSVRPQLVEVSWDGQVVDVASVAGVAAAGFPRIYPRGVTPEQTQPAAARWHAAGHEGVVCRSASLERVAKPTWRGAHEAWAELAIFVENARTQPSLLARRDDLDWLSGRQESSSS